MRVSVLTLFATLLPLLGFAEAPRASRQIEDLESLPDATERLLAQIESANGSLLLTQGIYRITRPLEIQLKQERRIHIRSLDGPVTLIMDGPGPALRIVGSHEGTASPRSFETSTWHESFPIIEGLEIIGNHPESVGVELIRCVKPTLTRLSIRWCHHGIVLAERNRNVTVSDVHLYENSGIGLFLNDVNLHQINVANSHISYNREGGIVVRNGNVRNLQIANCDIEANMPADDTPTETANILLDVSKAAHDPAISIAEVAITGSTIQHSSNYSRGDMKEIAPGGANIRILGHDEYPIDSVTVHGNVISDTSVLVDVHHAVDVNFTGNTFFAPNPDFVHIRDSERVILNGNTFNPRQFERPGRIEFFRSRHCLMTANSLRGLASPDHAVLVKECRHMSLINNHLSESTAGILVQNSQGVIVRDWTVADLASSAPFLRKDTSSEVTE